jgi:uncharacterized HAD superfamily protein
VTKTLNIHVDTWWKYAHDMIATYLKEILAKHHVDEKLYKKKLRFYKETYLDFIY